ncbi:MAG: outer membrane protein transport protein, partial [Alphaproteobacteria bacterium]|nr:outer membrane protein transport protein [Alphaproteobacteria bacterium]
MKKSPLIAMTAAAAIFSGHALAAGFQLSDQSVTGLGRAFAGAGIMGDDLSAIAYNPAGLSLIRQNSIQAGGSYIDIKSRFRNGTFDGGAIDDTDPTGHATVPHFYAVFPVNDQFTAGIGVFVPFGLGTEYDPNWGGRSHAVMSDVMTININPSFSYKLNDQWSFGAGISAQRISGELTSNPGVFTTVKGSDWGLGWNAGVMWTPLPQARLGLSYRSQIKHSLTGNLKNIMVGTVPVSLDITTPAYAYLSGAYDVTDKATVSAM